MTVCPQSSTKKSRWMAWQPKALIMSSSAPNEPTKPSKPGFVGFVGSVPSQIPNISGPLLEQVTPQIDATEILTSAIAPGVRLISSEPKKAPVKLTEHSVVTDVDRFIRMTLLELKAALAGQRWQSGHWSVRDLVDRLEQCGVRVEIESRKNLSFRYLPGEEE
jgi:hypothetical protein